VRGEGEERKARGERNNRFFSFLSLHAAVINMACALISSKPHTVLRSLCMINNAAEERLFDPWNRRNLGTICFQSEAVQVGRGFLAES